jgi:hypothetical protein
MEDTLFASLKKSVQRFREIFAETKSPIVRDAAIQRFEFAAEDVYRRLASYFPLFESLMTRLDEGGRR